MLKHASVFFLMVCVAGLTGLPAWAQEDEGPPPAKEIVLESTGLVSAQPEAVLPRGALVHLRINSTNALLADFNAMAMKFLPEKTLPPDMQPYLEMPNPLLAIMGTQATGAPTTPEQMSQLTGIDFARPLTFSLYMPDPTQFMALSIPMKDPVALTALLRNMFRPQSFEKIDLEDLPVYEMKLQNPDLPPVLYLACAKDSVYVVTSPILVQMLHDQENIPRLNQAPLIAKSVRKHSKDNLLLVIDTDPIKPMLPMLRKYGQIPAPNVDAMRQQFFQMIPPDVMQEMELRMRAEYGVRDMNQLLDYGEALGLATWEVLFAALFDQAQAVEGVTVAIDLAAADQTVRLAIHSAKITPDAGTKPVPLAAVRKALAQMPGSRNYLVAQGQSPKPQPSALGAKWFAGLKAHMQRLELPLTLHQALHGYFGEYEPDPIIESKVPWAVTTRYLSKPDKSVGQFDSLATYGDYLMQGPITRPITMQAIPKQRTGFLETHFKEWVAARNRNDARYRKMLVDLKFTEPFYLKESRSHTKSLKSGAAQIAIENAYTTRFGLFGYDEHELVNRWYVSYRPMGSLTLIQNGGRDASPLVEFAGADPPAPAILRLLDKAPAGTSRIEILRMSGVITDTVAYLEQVEALAGRELDAYLAAADKIVLAGGGRLQMLEQLEALPMPASAALLKLDPEANQCYVVLPIGVTYPRARVMPAVKQLLADYNRQAPGLGGLALYQRALPGEYEVTLVQNTEAAGLLVRSLINNAFTQYFSDEAGQRRLGQLMAGRYDHVYQQHSTVASNPMWQFLGLEEPLGPILRADPAPPLAPAARQGQRSSPPPAAVPASAL